MAAAGTLQTLLTLKNRCVVTLRAQALFSVDKSVYEIEGCSVVKHNLKFYYSYSRFFPNYFGCGIENWDVV